MSETETEAATETATTETSEATTLLSDAGGEKATDKGQDATDAPADKTEGEEPKGDAEKDGEGKDKDADGKADDQSKGFEAFTLPDGMELDQEGMESFTDLAKGLKLNQEQAQGLVTLYAERMQAAMADVQKVQQEQFQEQLSTWEKDSRADKEFGGEKLDENLAVAKKALDRFGSPELTELLTKTGLGNHPEVIRAFHRVGKAIADDGHIMPGAGGGSSDDPESRARRHFPNTYKD